MRRLLLAGLLAAAAIPLGPAHAGPAACVVAEGFPVCAGNCANGDPVTVIVLGVGSGTASCGGADATCYGFRGVCTTGDQASGPGALSCGGSAPVVICLVGITAANSPYASLVS